MTFAILSIPFAGLAAALEWYGPTYGSSPWLRRFLWLAFAACVALAVYTEYDGGI